MATRVAARARAKNARRSGRERQEAVVERPAPAHDIDGYEVPRIIHEELSRLPERLRAPIVLCHLQGLTHEQAAERLRCPVGTVRSRLSRSRLLLRARLTRRGMASSAATMGAAIAGERASASVPTLLAGKTVAGAVEILTRKVVATGAASASIAFLVKGVLRSMFTTKLKMAASALLALGLIATGVGVYALQPPEGAGAATAVDAAPREAGGEAHVHRPSPTIAKTYYVGDLVAPPAETGAVRPGDVEMGVMIDLITSTIMSDTWSIHPADGRVARRFVRDVKAPPASPTGSITPFFLSVSLIIRHTPEAHEQISGLLRHLRRLRELQTQAPGRAIRDERSPASFDPSPSPAAAHPRPRRVRSGVPARGASPATGENRLRQLVKELNDEVEDLIRQRDDLRRSRPETH